MISMSFKAAIVLALPIFAAAQTPDQRCADLTHVNAATFPNHTIVVTSAALKAASQAVTKPGGRGNVPALPRNYERAHPRLCGRFAGLGPRQLAQQRPHSERRADLRFR